MHAAGRDLHRQEPERAAELRRGANDYRLGWGTLASMRRRTTAHVMTRITPLPAFRAATTSTAAATRVVFDRDGVVDYSQINFNRTDDTSGVWVNCSTNGGFTWTRPWSDSDVAAAERAGRVGGR